MKVKKRLLFSTLATAILTAALLVVPLSQASDGGFEARASLRNQAGQLVGRVTFEEESGKVMVRVVIFEGSGLSPGFHGFHVHAIGSCLPETGFLSAGGHYNPAGVGHGQHAGDLPVLLVNDDGSAKARFETDNFTVEDILGRSLIVHLNADNYANIPSRYHSHADLGGSGLFGPDGPPNPPPTGTRATGDAGPRPFCGVIQED